MDNKLTDPVEYERAMLLEDYDQLPDEAHAERLHWKGKGLKPALSNGRRQIPHRKQHE